MARTSVSPGPGLPVPPSHLPNVRGNLVREQEGPVLRTGPRDPVAASWKVEPPSARSGFRSRAATKTAPGLCKGVSGGGLHDMLDYFDMVVCVNLDRRKDRWASFAQKALAVDWPFSPIQRFVATDGEVCPPPHGWKAGRGAWGCMQSHRRILERALMEGHDRILVLEDDAYFMENFGRDVRKFLGKVPNDWDCLMVGGQHIEAAEETSIEGVLRCRNTQRTHAYALQGSFIETLYKEWQSRQGHCDHIMGPLAGKHNTYAPTKFLIGQDEGRSDINGRVMRPRLWQPPKETDVGILIGDRAMFEAEIGPNGKGHGGYSRNPVTGVDLGIESLIKDGTFNTSKLVSWWIPMLAWEAESIQRRVVIWHPEISKWADQIVKATRGMILQ